MNPRPTDTTDASKPLILLLLPALFIAAAFTKQVTKISAQNSSSLNAQKIASQKMTSNVPRGRLHLLAKYAPGQVLRYQIDMRNTSRGKTGGIVEDPEAASQLKQSSSVLIRLDVLGPAPLPAPSPTALKNNNASGETAIAGKSIPSSNAPQTAKPQSVGPATRIKATYEQSTATVDSDAYDEQAENLAAQYRQLKGQSLTFSMSPSGRILDLSGLDKIMQDPSAATTARGWMSNISPAGGFPRRGIILGEKWPSEEKLQGAPLKGTVWRAESSYVRNEPCEPRSLQKADAQKEGITSAAAKDPAPQPLATQTNKSAAPINDTCAVILTHFKILQADPSADLTPPVYAKEGMHTSGSWIGEGESLSSISLRTGFVVSVSQNARQQMDFTISSRTSTARFTYTGEVTSQTEIQLLGISPPQ